MQYRLKYKLYYNIKTIKFILLYKMNYIFLLINFLLFSNAYVLNNPIKVYKKYYNDKYIKVYEPKNTKKKDLKSIILYTGANSLIPGEIYSNFIKNLNDWNFSVIVVNNDNEVTTQLLYDISNKYDEIISVSHSTGCVNMLKTINSQENIKKAVLLDPVDNSELFKLPFNLKNNPTIKFLENLLVIYAEKAYKWNFFPKFEIPFIPGFSLDLKKLQKTKSDLIIEKITAENYGHSDILDSLWGDLMHATISKGYDDRDKEVLDNYHNWLATKIYEYVHNKPIKQIIQSNNNTYNNTDIEISNYIPTHDICNELHVADLELIDEINDEINDDIGFPGVDFDVDENKKTQRTNIDLINDIDDTCYTCDTEYD